MGRVAAERRPVLQADLCLGPAALPARRILRAPLAAGRRSLGPATPYWSGGLSIGPFQSAGGGAFDATPSSRPAQDGSRTGRPRLGSSHSRLGWAWTQWSNRRTPSRLSTSRRGTHSRRRWSRTTASSAAAGAGGSTLRVSAGAPRPPSTANGSSSVFGQERRRRRSRSVTRTASAGASLAPRRVAQDQEPRRVRERSDDGAGLADRVLLRR